MPRPAQAEGHDLHFQGTQGLYLHALFASFPCSLSIYHERVYNTCNNLYRLPFIPEFEKSLLREARERTRRDASDYVPEAVAAAATAAAALLAGQMTISNPTRNNGISRTQRRPASGLKKGRLAGGEVATPLRLVPAMGVSRLLRVQVPQAARVKRSRKKNTAR